MRRAVGDAAGLTIKGQIRRAAQNLGLPPDAWRVREAWYGRAGGWSAEVLDAFRQRYAAWRREGRTDRERGGNGPSVDRQVLAEHVAAIWRCLAEVERLLALIERTARGE